MKEYQFTTDSYRFYAAVHRLCHCPDDTVGWYNCGPSQKFLLRQIKAMDHSLLNKRGQQNLHIKDYPGERAGYTAKDRETGKTIYNDDMDVQMLMLYGHMLFVGGSYANTFNYFYRANALDPGNPMILLCIGLAYIHYSLKRQAENRHYLIMQGFTFMFRYHELRTGAQDPAREVDTEEKMEANFNVGRAFHMLGKKNSVLGIGWMALC